MRVFSFIFARGGSKGVPGKNIKNINGKPLLGHTIELIQNIKSIGKIFVSTEDDKIADVAEKFGAELIPRPISLAQDDSPEWLAWQHAVEWLEERGHNFDIFYHISYILIFPQFGNSTCIGKT